METVSTRMLVVLYLGVLCQPTSSILIVHHFEESEASTSRPVYSVTVNISREVIANEVGHGLETVHHDIKSIKEKYGELHTKVTQDKSEKNEQYKQFVDEMNMKDDYIEHITDQVLELEGEVQALREGLVRMYQEYTKYKGLKASSKGIPAWYRKLRQKRLMKKVEMFQKGLLGEMLPPKDDKMDTRHFKGGRRGFCEEYKEEAFQIRGVPQWVQDMKRYRYNRECGKQESDTKVNSRVPTYAKQESHHGYEEATEEGETTQQQEETQSTGLDTSRKSQKRKIDEVFLKLMMRSQRMSWTDLNLMKENWALFMEHVTGTAKLCSRVLVYPERKSFEACKERVGLNFAMSLVVALTTTVLLVTSVLVSTLVLFRLKVVMTERIRWETLSPSKLLGTLKMPTTPKHIQALMHQVASPDICVLVSGEDVLDQSKRLVERLITSTGVKLSPLYHPLATLTDFQLLPRTKAYLVIVDLSNSEDKSIFEDEAGQNNVLFKVNEELMAQSAQTFLVCTHDPESRQLPRGSLYNKALVSRNDNYILRTYCRGQRCVTCNQEFTQTQATHLQRWLLQTLDKN